MLTPLAANAWDQAKAAHLWNRAGFGANPQEINRLTGLGLEKAVAELVDYEKIPDFTADPDWAQPDPHRAEFRRELAMADDEQKKVLRRMRNEQRTRQMVDLRHWWLLRMFWGPRPLQEKMTLFWHGLFATSIQKVEDPYFMWLQNETFRSHAVGNWSQMLVAVAKDPAMLVWLDGASSRKGKPNENFAREVMELFTLGEGHYSEDDIKAAALSFTGWTIDRDSQTFVDRPQDYDRSRKTFRGTTGAWTGQEVLWQLSTSADSAQYLARRLWIFFANDQPPEPVITALAETFSKSNQELKPLLRRLFLSQEFYAPDVMRHQVKSPVQWLVSTCRYLERSLPPGVVCNQMMKMLGQQLFNPPSVKGWDGGVSWITTNNLLTRYNLAGILVQGQGEMADAVKSDMLNKSKDGNVKVSRPMIAAAIRESLAPLEVEKIFTPEELANKEKLLPAMEQRLMQAELKPARTESLRSYLDSQPNLDADAVRHAVRLLMSTPDYQLT